MRRVVGVLLAAGGGQRFGSNKLLAVWKDGQPLAVVAARKLVSVLPESIAVVRPGDVDLASLLATQGLRVVECSTAEAGMGHSLAAGIAAADDADAWLVALADMPAILISTLTRLVTQLQAGRGLVAPFHAGQRGHPVGFGKEFHAELRALTGNKGARELLTRHADVLFRDPVSDPGVLQDVDTPADLKKALAE